MIVKTENLSREFVRGKNQFYAVDHVNLEVEEKELVAIMSPRCGSVFHRFA